MTVGDMDHNDSKEQMEYTDEFQRQSEAFLAWLRRSGANINPAIALQDLRQKAAGRGIGMRLLRPIMEFPPFRVLTIFL